MDGVLLTKAVAAFGLVLGLMLLVLYALKRFGPAGASTAAGKRRLSVLEHLPLDHRRRLVIVKCDGREHLLLLGPERETVIETNLPTGASS